MLRTNTCKNCHILWRPTLRKANEFKPDKNNNTKTVTADVKKKI